jgi:predicted DNA-binding transcriptional regulator YafY
MGDILCHPIVRWRRMRADRLVSIILMLQNRGPRTCAGLADELEVSRRTILRDLDALSTAGVPVIAEGGHGGGVRLDESYRAGLTGLGEGELRALLIGADAALARDLGMGDALRLGQLKLQAAQAKRFEPALDILQRRLLIDSRWWWHDASADPFLAPLQAAVFADEIVHADYQHYDGSARRGPLQPHALVAKSGLWYLVAARAGQLRTYRVSRFRGVRATGKHFQRSPAFDIRAWWPANRQQVAAAFSSFRFTLALPDQGLSVVRRIAPGRVEIVCEPPRREGWKVAEVAVDSSLYAELIVLALGADCRVLAPASLAQAVAARARVALRTHAAR